MAGLMALPLVVSPLAGCAVGPDYARPALDLPRRWSDDTGKRPKSAPAPLAQWWRRLGDPLLNELIDEAVKGNLDVAAAKARVREARALLQQTSAALLPQSSGSGSATANRSGAASDTVSPTSYNQFRAGFDSAWELDLFGANRRAVEAATSNVEAADEDLNATLLTLIGDVASYYIEARGYQARAALARRTAASQRAVAVLTQDRLTAGSATGLDTSRAVAQAASTEANVPTHEAAYRDAVHRLGVLLGRDPTALAARLGPVRPIPTPRLPLPKGIPADVLTKRPDVRKAERQLAQYTARIGQAEAAQYPSVSLSGSVSTTALRLGDLGKNSTIGWSIGPTVSVPIFNGGKLRAAVEVARSQRDEYHIAWRRAVLTALKDVESAIVSLAQERIKIRSLAESAQHYGEAARLSRSLYESGSSSFLDVLDAERSQFSAEDSLLQSRVNLARNYVALAKALGGGWNGAIEISKPEVVDRTGGPRLAPKR